MYKWGDRVFDYHGDLDVWFDCLKFHCHTFSLVCIVWVSFLTAQSLTPILEAPPTLEPKTFACSSDLPTGLECL